MPIVACSETLPGQRPVDRLAFVDLWDPNDAHNWSGIPASMATGLSAQWDVRPIGNLSRSYRALFVGHKLYYRLRNERFLIDRTALAQRRLGAQLDRRIEGCSPAIIFAAGSVPISAVGGRVPAVFWTDATFPGLMEYYDGFSAYNERSVTTAVSQERRALERASLAVFASDWAAEQVSRHYPEHAHKVRVVPFGANLDPGLRPSDADSMVATKSYETCELLFTGVDWRRKGGPTVLETAALLVERGVPARLSIVGCSPFGNEPPPPFVSVEGFLSRGDPAGLGRLDALFRRAHFLFVPSRAEAFGIVYCEAAAFALPCIATRTGGIPVRDGRTGITLPVAAGPPEYADAIEALWRDRARYSSLALAAHADHLERLNWRTATERVSGLAREVLAG